MLQVFSLIQSKDESATEKEAFAVHQCDLKFDLHLRGAEYILCCDHKPLESILAKHI